MWVYKQTSGELSKDDKLVCKGYSGHGDGKNNPLMQYIRNVGPIPIGEYYLGEAYQHPRKGSLCMRVLPLRTVSTHGRSGFLIHGDSIKNPGTASQGCIILSRSDRQKIASSEDRHLIVIT